MSLIELPRRKRDMRTFIEAPPGLQRRVVRALTALGELPDDLELPGLDVPTILNCPASTILPGR